jgi:murein DD-endopeptidase MepM/ murein hydrolase activator NlpD
MRRALITLLVLLPLASLPLIDASAADPEQLCGHMLDPAVALKQVSRGFNAWHSGLDLTAPYGSPVRAAADGTVIYAGRYFAYGNIVDIRHENGIVTRYAHLSAFAPGLGPGTRVAGGDAIGRIGTSGLAHGAHVHFEVRINGRPVDPKPWLALAACTAAPSTEPLEEARAPDETPAPVAKHRRVKH